MPLGVKPADIHHEKFRRQLERARQLLDEEQYRDCVEACGAVYLAALTEFPSLRAGLDATLADPKIAEGIAAEIVRVAPFLWPRYVAKLDLSGTEPRIRFDRERASFTEAIQYYEFTVNLVFEAEQAAGTAP